MRDTTFLKFVGILLIVNSHAGCFYPIQMKGTGGAIGNSIFFMLSAYGLFLSEIKQRRSFAEWYSRRVARIYPSVWVTLLLLYFPILIIFGQFNGGHLLDYLGLFFYPPFWFIQALMVIYFLLFYLIRNYTDKRIVLYSATTLILYFLFYFKTLDLSKFVVEDLPFKIIFYFGICLFGLWCANNKDKIFYKGVSDFVYLIIFIVIMYGHKFFMTKHLFSSMQFLEQASLFPIVYFLFKISKSRFVDQLFEISFLDLIINFVSGLTLEIYIVHMTIIPVIQKLSIPFPFGMILFIVATLSLAKLVKILADKFNTTINNTTI